MVTAGTIHTWEKVFNKPELSDEYKAALISTPWESRSDSFYFAEGQLVIMDAMMTHLSSTSLI